MAKGAKKAGGATDGQANQATKKPVKKASATKKKSPANKTSGRRKNAEDAAPKPALAGAVAFDVAVRDVPTKAQADADLCAQDEWVKKNHPEKTQDCQCAVAVHGGPGITIKKVRSVACDRVADDYDDRYGGRVTVTKN